MSKHHPAKSHKGDSSAIPSTAASTHPSSSSSSSSSSSAASTNVHSHHRSYEEDCKFIHRMDANKFKIDVGFVPDMKVPGYFYVNEVLEPMMFDELKQAGSSGGVGGFLPAVKQIANVASLPGIVGASIGLPDVHSGYGFAIGNVAAFDMDDPEAIVSPGGVGFDINCGVRLIRTNLHEDDVRPVQEKLTQSLFDHIPVGVGSKGVIPTRMTDLVEALEMGMDWSLREGYAWAEDKEHTEEFGRMLNADPSKVSQRAKKRGLPQLGTLGAGNHYCEIQIVEEIYDKDAAAKMGIEFVGQVCIMVHSGSRGLGHQVATDALTDMERAMARDGIHVNDKQLACARINSKEGQDYLAAMSAAANYAWVNRSSMTFLVRQTFAKMFNTTPDDLDMHVIYDVSHNIAKMEEHLVDGKRKKLLVHRKGATRAFPPHHPLIPVDYQLTGQPVLIGGTMGTHCLAFGTLVALADGRCLPCEQLTVGMALTGQDGAVVKIQQLGHSVSPVMYRVHTNRPNSVPYLVTPNHRVTLSWARPPSVVVLPPGTSNTTYWRLRIRWHDSVQYKYQCKTFRCVPSDGEISAPQISGEATYETEEDAWEIAADAIDSSLDSIIMSKSTQELIQFGTQWLNDHVPAENRMSPGDLIDIPAEQLAQHLSAWTMVAHARYSPVTPAALKSAQVASVTVSDQFDQLAMFTRIDRVEADTNIVSLGVSGNNRYVLGDGTLTHNSYVLTGTSKGMTDSFGSTCHGAGRAMSRNKSRRALDYKGVLEQLAEKGISIRVASPKLVCEEAPESYKDVTQVVRTCHDAGISKLCIKLKPIAVVKG